MKYYKVEIEETRKKTVFIQVPDYGNQDLAIGQYDAGVSGGDLPEKENDKLMFTDYDRGVEYGNHILSIKEVDMEEEEKYAEKYYEFPECVMWDENQNCITTGWYEND